MASIVQMLPIVNRRDAIGKLAINIARLLKRNAIENLIVTERQESLFHFGLLRSGLNETTIPDWASLGIKQPGVVIYHHSIGTQVAEHFLNLPAKKKILIYHGVTPSDLLPASQREMLIRGAEQVARVVKEVDCAVAFSGFTSQELKSAGASEVLTLPYYFPGAMDRHEERRRLNPTVLVVGRVMRHKRILECLEAFREFIILRPTAKLFIIGSIKGDPEYVRSLRQYINDNNLSEAVVMTGKVSGWRLRRLYGRASLLLTLSEHEGFCVPVVEALRQGLSVVATTDGALSETVGNAGVLLVNRDPKTVAAGLVEALNVTHECFARIESHLLNFEPERFEVPFLRAITA